MADFDITGGRGCGGGPGAANGCAAPVTGNSGASADQFGPWDISLKGEGGTKGTQGAAMAPMQEGRRKMAAAKPPPPQIRVPHVAVDPTVAHALRQAANIMHEAARLGSLRGREDTTKTPAPTPAGEKL